MELVAKLLYMIALLVAGVGARSIGLVTPPRRDLLNDVAFYVALPALVFSSTHSQELGEVVSPDLLVGLWAVLFVMAGVSWFVHRRAPSEARSVAVVQSYHCNLGYLGLPMVAATFGELTTAKASILLGMGILTQVPLTIFVLSSLTADDLSLAGELRGFAADPVILSLAAGLAVSTLPVTVPAAPAAGLALLSELALPIALLCVGASLTPTVADVEFATVGAVVALKVLVMPLVAVAVFSLLTSEASTLRAGIVMLATPTAVSTYIYANEYGGDPRLASINIFATTVASLATLFVLIRFAFAPV